MKKGFTLAEIMIVLTVIGILTAVLLPVAFNAAPDEDVMKFKKANSTFGTAVRELINSDKYFLNGSFGKTSANATPTATYFCQALGDILSVKSTGCSATSQSGCGKVSASNIATAKSTFDSCCAKATYSHIITSDGVYWYDPNSNQSFNGLASSGTFDTNYKVWCLDIDGSGGEAPFGYGVRQDGKILPGKRADDWVALSVQRKDD